MIYAEPEDCRGRSFHGLLAYLLHDAEHAAGGERVLFAAPVNLASTSMDRAADELADLARRALIGRRQGQRPDRPVFHFVLSWHPDDTPETAHMIETARSALAALGLAEHLAVIIGHTDTGKPHIHVVTNVLHPVTGKAAKLGWRYRTMSRWAAAYEWEQGVVRCDRRQVMKAANESRRRLTRPEWEGRAANKRKASNQPAPRP